MTRNMYLYWQKGLTAFQYARQVNHDEIARMLAEHEKRVVRDRQTTPWLTQGHRWVGASMPQHRLSTKMRKSPEQIFTTHRHCDFHAHSFPSLTIVSPSLLTRCFLHSYAHTCPRRSVTASFANSVTSLSWG